MQGEGGRVRSEGIVNIFQKRNLDILLRAESSNGNAGKMIICLSFGLVKYV